MNKLININEKGITLMALVISIIVLLILAGVSISILSGENGILKKATGDKLIIEVKSIEEQIRKKQIMSDSSISGSINDVLGIHSSYNDKIYIEGGELVYFEDKVSSEEKENLENIGIYPKGETTIMARNNSKSFWKEEYRTKITDIYFKRGNTSVPSDAIDLGDISATSENPEIRTYLQEEGTKLTIISRYRIYAYKNMYVYFSGFDNLTSIQFDNFDTSQSTNLYGMFQHCKNLTNINVENWNTSKVTDMGYMFYECNNLAKLDVSNFDTQNVTNMQCMFDGCNNVDELDVSNFDTKNVTSMLGMFGGCSKLTSIDVSNFNTSNVTKMTNMFAACNNVAELDVSNFDTSKTESMGGMFSGCKKLTTIDVSNFDTSNVTSMYTMFHNCSSLQSLDVSDFNTSKVTSMGYMFRGCISLTELNLRNFDTSNVTAMECMFYGCSSMQSLDVTSFNTRKVTIMNWMFLNCEKLNKLYFGENWTTENATTTDMFAGCTATIYYYSENEPTDGGNYWHFIDNQIVEW